MKKAPPKLERLSRAKQRRLDQLLDRNSEGTISAREKARLEELVAEAERLMVANGKKLARFAQASARGSRAGSVPITVWVQPEAAKQ
jgi:hypothetical protein